MYNFNQLIMVIIVGILLWLANLYIPLPPVLSLLINMILIVMLVIYIMQFLGVIRAILPAPKFRGF